MEKELTCIGCPVGCRLSVALGEKGEFLSLSGNGCKVGEKYGEEECTQPKRMVTALVRVKGRKEPLSVKTDKPVDKDKIFDCLRRIAETEAKPPVNIGDVIISGVCGGESNVVATRRIL